MPDPKNLVYEPDPRGVLSARQAVCAYYAQKGAPVFPDQVFLTSGTSEAYQFLFRLLANPGDEVCAAEPSYPLFVTLSELNDVTLKKFGLIYENGWRIDFSSLNKSLSDKTRAVLVVHPNNPTGNFVRTDAMKKLDELCAQKRCALIADEVFFDFAWDPGSQHETFAANRRALTFTVSGISKILGLPQMKLGWIVVSGPEDRRREAMRRLEVIADATLSVNTPSQNALPAWLSLRGRVRDEILERVRENFSYLNQALDKKRVRAPRSEGGWVAVLKTDGPKNDEETALYLLDKKNVLLHPGYFFDFPSEDYLVVSLLPETSLFQEAVDFIV